MIKITNDFFGTRSRITFAVEQIAFWKHTSIPRTKMTWMVFHKHHHAFWFMQTHVMEKRLVCHQKFFRMLAFAVCKPRPKKKLATKQCTSQQGDRK